MRERPKRKAIPLKVKVEACLIMLGWEDWDAVEWDHFPALQLRPLNADGTDYDPPQLDPHYIQPLKPIFHALKTNGPKHDHSQGDKGRIAHTKRLADAPVYRDIFANGKLAAKRGEPVTNNPHPKGKAKSAWASGWYEETSPRLRPGWQKRSAPATLPVYVALGNAMNKAKAKRKIPSRPFQKRANPHA